MQRKQDKSNSFSYYNFFLKKLFSHHPYNITFNVTEENLKAISHNHICSGIYFVTGQHKNT